MTGLDIVDLRDMAVRPALEAIGHWSEPAEALVLGTACQESGLFDLVQRGGGPALGLWQVEPATHDDLWRNYLAYRLALATRLRRLVSLGNTDGAMVPLAHECAWNLRYGAAICRLLYLRTPEPIPSVNDVSAMAALWKLRYNTPLGKGTEEQFARAYRARVLPLYGGDS